MPFLDVKSDDKNCDGRYTSSFRFHGPNGNRVSTGMGLTNLLSVHGNRRYARRTT